MKLFLCLAMMVSSVIAEETSGTIEKGLRILEIKADTAENNYTVYRGDYVKFKLDPALKEIEFNIPDLQFKEKVSSDLDKSKLVKMAKVGEFSYTLGNFKGKIKVIEYQQANYKFIEAKEAKELIDNVRPLIIDVRTAGEYAQGKIAGSLLIPIDEIQMRYSEIEKYKNQDVFIYCASGNRSTVAARILINNGFKRIYNLKNGIAGWQASGYSVEK